jgi:hypothetical protein
LSVGHDARQFPRLGNPATVIFPIDLNGKVHPYIVSEPGLPIETALSFSQANRP